jgi:four helix bundle protein
MQGSFRKLFVWQRAKGLAVRVYAITGKGELRRDWGLRDQMRRAAVSIASNIAEGSERGSDREACQYFYVAKGSVGELLTQLEIAADAGLVETQQSTPLITECEELGRMIRGLIKYRLPSRPSPLAPRSYG